MWIGLLFSIICLAVATLDLPDAGPGNEHEQRMLQVNLYREKIAQCLVASDYTKTGPYVAETMCHYLHIEFAISADANKDALLLLGMTVKVVMRMGYHRDPSHFPGLSPLQGEMRRRLWSTLLLGDTLISTQMGMPRTISDSHWDAAEPQNLNDSDLDPSATELPPARPETEHTSALGIIARRRMVIAVGTVSDLQSNVRSSSYAEVMRVDGVLHEARASLPQHLQMKSMAASVTDSPQIIIQRIYVAQMFHKGQIMLHRRFLFMDSPTPDQDAFAYSRKSCLDAALRLLEIQQTLDAETCPAGQLHMMRWRLSSLLNHQFLTATIILCSMLYRNVTLQRKEEMVAALQRSRTIWMRNSFRSKESHKAADTVNAVLAKMVAGGYQFGSDNGSGAGTSTTGSSVEQRAFASNMQVHVGFDAGQILHDLDRASSGERRELGIGSSPAEIVLAEPEVLQYFTSYASSTIAEQGYGLVPNTEESNLSSADMNDWITMAESGMPGLPHSK